MNREAGATVKLFMIFAGMGASASSIPAMLPALIAREPGAASTYLLAVPALFAGLMLGVIGCWAARQFSWRRVAASGAVLQAVALAGLASAPEARWTVLLAALVGLGFGLVECAATVGARALARLGTSRLLAALTGTVALVAAAIPALASLTPPETVVSRTFGAVALLQIVGAAAALLASESAEQPLEPGVAETRMRLSIPLLAGLALALYVGVESLMSGGSAVVIERMLDVELSQASLGTSAFWLLLAGGRGLATGALTLRVPARVCLAMASGAAVIAFALAATVASSNAVLAVSALAVAVVALGPIYSLVIGIVLSEAPVGEAGRLTAPLVAAGAAGGAAVPAAATVAGLLPGDAAIYIAAAVLMVAVPLLIVRRTDPASERSSARGTRGFPRARPHGRSPTA